MEGNFFSERGEFYIYYRKACLRKKGGNQKYGKHEPKTDCLATSADIIEAPVGKIKKFKAK